MIDLQPPYGNIWNLVGSRKVVPFLGAGASLCAHDATPWNGRDPRWLPTARELGTFLADEANFPAGEPTSDLAKVAAFYSMNSGRSTLRSQLRTIFGRDYPVGKIHRLLADVEGPCLIMTTNYDDLIERAFRAAGKPFDLVVYPSERDEHAASLLYWPHGAESPEFVPPKKLRIDLDHKTVIYKMHGAVDLKESKLDSFVISEDDYINFLIRMEGQKAIPPTFTDYFSTSSFLFLGYGLADWNFRVILGRIEKHTDVPSWAIQLGPSALERALWDQRRVLIYDMAIDQFVVNLRARVGLPPDPS